MVLEQLGERLRSALQGLAKGVFLDDRVLDALVLEIRRALLQADVNVELVNQLAARIRKRSAEDAGALSRKEHAVKIVYEELVAFLGESEASLDLSGRPAKVMLLGLYGAGKTTTAGKLASYFRKRGNRVALLQTDASRPAALEQLQQLGRQAGVEVFGGGSDAVSIYRKFAPALSGFDVVIIDTSGRDALSKDLIREMNALNAEAAPQERLLVMPADMGQAAERQAKAFAECGITGVIITRLEGTAKGGGALTACAVTGAPVKFVGVGEKMEDLERFSPRGFVGRMLGMGDMDALMEKAREALPEEKAEDLGKRLLKGEFTLIDLYEQMQAMSTMGPLGKVMEMIPGFGQLKMPKEALQVQEVKLRRWRHMMDSMTQEELEDPEVIGASRSERIAKGSGGSPAEVRELVSQYRQSKKLVRVLKDPRGMQQMMKRMGGAGGAGFRLG